MELTLYNTLGRTLQTFKPIKPKEIYIYACGPTVYNFAHIGNLKTYINEDILKRTLRFNGFKVKHVENITDVGHLVSDEDTGEDKMELSASKEGLTIWEIAGKYTQAFKEDITALNIQFPNVWCKATDHINEQIELVKKLEELGLTYIIEDGVYYDTSKFSDYGILGGQKLEELQAGARVQLAEGKRNNTDFALWKISPKESKRLMEWESPWGVGFPGWHIECSAMALKYLGEQIDIHCGGVDHVKVHHTNEIAQVEPVTQKKWVNFWFHVEFLNEKDGKMSKSKGEFLTLSLLKKKGFEPLAYRYYVLNSHYRSKLNFSFEALESARQGFSNLIDKISLLKADVAPGEVAHAQLDDIHLNINTIINKDLNTPELMAYMWKVIKDQSINVQTKLDSLQYFDQILGLELLKIEAKKEEDVEVSSDLQDLLDKRNEAKKLRDFKTADALRNEIQAQGYAIIDTKDGAKLKKL
ncbi:MAG: cysteine--tRNA ligase [Bacteriovoracaceae bacterium]|nr:cysteine--tRNA ligase [Bacteriovoracaceae bacterium]